MSKLGVVIIGRNEGERLRACLASVAASGVPVVYVDSQSSDGSVAVARTSGADVVELDRSRPVSAARARNEGFARLTAMLPGARAGWAVEYVQFIDGDCVVVDGWLKEAAAFLDRHPAYAVVSGRLRERFPQASIYNRLCAMEWQRPAGEVRACGGIFMVRAQAFRAVRGFREDVIAAEDDELCLRLHRNGGKLLSIDADMGWHDAAMTRFRQWWKRAKRTGHAYAQGAALHGKSPDRHFVRQCCSTWLWGLVFPLLAGVPAWWTHGFSLLLLGGYVALGVKIYRHGRRRGWSRGDARLYATFTMIAKWPQLLGMLQYYSNRLRGRRQTLIEYKPAGQTRPVARENELRR